MSEEFEYIQESLEISESQDLVKKEENVESLALKKDIKDDFQYARKNIKIIIDTGMDAINTIHRLVTETENARFAECLSNLLQINSVNNTLLLDLDMKMKDMIDGKDEHEGGDTITNNNTLFVATTTDIQRMIEEKIKGSK